MSKAYKATVAHFVNYRKQNGLPENERKTKTKRAAICGTVCSKTAVEDNRGIGALLKR